MRAGIRVLVVLLLVLSLGVHWALLQTVAWAGMVVNYSREGSLAEAISQTFDGKHPCSLCKAIRKGRAEEKKHEHQRTNPDSRLEVGLIWRSSEFDFSNRRQAIAFSFDVDAPSRCEGPPKPRPRRIS